MYSDLFEQLGRGVGRSSGSNHHTQEPPPPLVAFKAGKVIMTLLDPIESTTTATTSETTTTATTMPRYTCVADTARGEVRLIHTESITAASVVGGSGSGSGMTNMANGLQWQWYDRRAQSVKETYRIREGSTFERIELPSVQQATTSSSVDRIYVWTTPKATATSDNNASSSNNNEMEYHMYWMQDADPSEDDEIVASVNQYLAEAGDAGEQMPLVGSTSGTGSSNNNDSNRTSNQQVDALSSILENLGIPAPERNGDALTATTNAQRPAANQLTLADLQGAMAGIAQQNELQAAAATPGPRLEDIVTQSAIESLLQDPAARQRLVALLPDDQQEDSFLRDNLQSPQLQATLRALTRALLPDDNGDLSGYASVIANFQLDPQAGQDALAAGNPIQAFLDCVLASVEQETKESDDTMDEEEKEAD